MNDKENVIKGLEQFKADFKPFCGNGSDWERVDDAIVLLKEQEAVRPKSKVRHGAYAQIQHFCGNCNTMLHGKPKYCSECGKAVLW